MKTISELAWEISAAEGPAATQVVHQPSVPQVLKALDVWQASVEEQLKALRAAVIPTGNYSKEKVDAFIEGRITLSELVGPIVLGEVPR